MKKFYLFIFASIMMLFSACHDKIWDAIDDLDARVAKLEELCKEMNTNISSLQTIVSVLQENDYITGILPIEKGGETIGYTITFGKHDPITIYNGEDGKDGTNGSNGQGGYTPILGVAKDTDGVYYWTLDGEWLLDVEGNKIRVTGENGKDGQPGTNGENGQPGKDGANGKDGITPKLKIENGYWYVSYDNEVTWIELGKAVGEDGKDGIDGEDGQDGKPGTDGQPGKDGVDGDSMFSNVTYDENNVYFILTNGTTLVVPRGNSSTSDFDQTVIDNLVSSLEINKDIIYLSNIGNKDTIIATTTPFSNSKVIWISQDSSIVKVENGVIEAISDGITKIIIKSGSLITECKVGVASLGKEGELPGLFSINSSNQRIQFSQGNLLYKTDNRWRFADNQYETNLSDWISLFGWGTSGYNNKFPTMTSLSYSDYAFGQSSADIYKTDYDWGTYNSIENGGNKPRLWHTIRKEDWEFIITKRPNANILHGVACVNGVNGLILLPDNWEKPKNIKFKSGLASSSGIEYSAINNYTIDEWHIMMTVGAVFLPVTNEDCTSGVYWTGSSSNSSSSNYMSTRSYSMSFSASNIETSSIDYGIARPTRLAVRLIRIYKD